MVSDNFYFSSKLKFSDGYMVLHPNLIICSLLSRSYIIRVNLFLFHGLHGRICIDVSDCNILLDNASVEDSYIYVFIRFQNFYLALRTLSHLKAKYYFMFLVLLLHFMIVY